MRSVGPIYKRNWLHPTKNVKNGSFLHLCFRNLRTAFSFKDKMQSEGIYMVENQTNVAKPGQPKKVLSVEGLRRALRLNFITIIQNLVDYFF